MKELYALFFYVFSMYFCYELAFKSGVDNEKYNSYLAEIKVRNCLEIISER